MYNYKSIIPVRANQEGVSLNTKIDPEIDSIDFGDLQTCILSPSWPKW